MKIQSMLKRSVYSTSKTNPLYACSYSVQIRGEEKLIKAFREFCNANDVNQSRLIAEFMRAVLKGKMK